VRCGFDGLRIALRLSCASDQLTACSVSADEAATETLRKTMRK